MTDAQQVNSLTARIGELVHLQELSFTLSREQHIEQLVKQIQNIMKKY